MGRQIQFSGPRVCVVGNINRDVKVHGVPGQSAILKDGETTISGINETIGGGGANSACAAAALGSRVRFVGKIGADALGERLYLALRNHRVAAYLSQSPDDAT